MYKRRTTSTYGRRVRRKVLRKAKTRRRATRTRSRKPRSTSRATRIKAAGVTPDRSIPIKRYEIHSDNNMQLQGTRDLKQSNLVFIPLQTTADEVNRRDTSRVTVIGVRLNWFWRTPAGRITPIWCNIAIVVPRNALTIEKVGMFRSYDTSREQDFDNLQSWWRFNFPLNKDRMEIIMHKRFLLSHNTCYNGNMNDTLPNTRNIKQMKIYQKINRQFTFDDSVGGEPRQAAPIVLHWYDEMAAISTSLPIANVVQLTRSTVVYYRED